MIVGWDNLEKYTEILGKKIKDSKFAVDIIVTIANSGMPSALILSKMLNIREVCFIKISLYEDRQKEFPVIEIKPYLSKLQNKNVLIVDDICSSGRTLEEAKKLILKELPRSVKTATSVVSSRVCKTYPDFYGEAIMRDEDDWISFPWDKYER